MENNGLCDIITTTVGGCGGSGTGKYMTSLAGLYGLATHYTAVTHPSEPNYLALIGGSTFGYTSDGNCCYIISSANIVDRLESAGLTWQAFAEDAGNSGTCSFSPPRSGDHFPFIDFSDMNTASRCSRFLTTSSPTDTEFLASLNSATPANYIWLTPNDSDNCHNTSVSFCDAYLSALVPLILSSTMFTTQRSALFIVFDEGNNYCPTGNNSSDCVYATWAGPVVKKASTSSNSYSHYSYLHTLEANWNLATITNSDAGAATMGEFFGTTNNLANQFDCVNWTCSNFLPPSALSVASNGTGEIRQSNPSVCDWNSSYYDSLMRGTLPPAQGPSQGTALPSNITSLTVSVDFLSRNLSPICSGPSGQGPRYHLFISLYFKLSSTVSACGIYSGSSWLDTQVRLENINGVDSAIGTTSTYGGGSDPIVAACGYSIATLQLAPGEKASLTANVGAQCANAETAWGIPLINTCTLTGIEIGSEGYDFNALNTNWYNIAISTDASPLSSHFTFTPVSPMIGQSVSFSATTTGGTAPYTYAWNFGDGGTSTANPSSHTYSASGAFMVSLKVTDSTSAYFTTSQTLNVSAPAPLTASFTLSPTNPAAGAVVSFSAPVSGGTPPYTNLWIFGDSISSVFNPTIHVYDTAGSFTVTFTVKDSSGGSANSSQTVNVGPAPTLTASFTYSPTSSQAGQQIAFSASARGGTAPYSFSWSFGDGSIGTGSTISHAYSSAGTFTVILTVKDSSTPQQSAASQQSVTTISPPTTLTASFTYNPSSPQVGQQVTFAASASGGTEPYAFAWSFGDGSTTTGSTLTHMYSSAGTFNVVLTVNDSGSPQQTANSQQTLIVTNSPPPLTTGFSHSPSSPEAGQQVTFTASASGGSTPYNFSWSFGDRSAASGNPSLHTYTSSGSYMVIVTVRDVNGGVANSSQTVTVATAPTVSFTYDPVSPETSSPVTFTANLSGGSPLAFNWSFGDGSFSMTNPASHTYSTSGTFTVTLNATDSDGVNASSSQIIIVAAAPALVVTFTNSPASPEAEQAVTFTATETGGVGNVSLSWDFGDNSSSTENPTTHTYTTSGFYPVSVTAIDANGVSTTSTQTVNVVASLGTIFTFSPSSPHAGDNITFVASTPGGVQPYNYSWSFGDSTTGSGSPVSHTYQSDGSYVVTLTLTDTNNQTANTNETITVKHRDESCHARADCVWNIFQTVNFKAIESSGTALYIFTWIFASFYNPSGLGREIGLPLMLAWESLRHRR